MELFKDFFAFLIDPARRFSARASLFVAVLTVLLLINNSTGFTYYYNVNNKLEKILVVNQVLKDSTLSLDNKVKLVALRDEIIYRRSLIDTGIDRFNDLLYSIKHSDKKQVIIAPVEYREPRSDLWFFISASGAFVLLTLFLVPFAVIGSVYSKGINLFGYLLGVLFIMFLIIIFALLNYYILNLIPRIFGAWGWNYFINFVFQMLQIGTLVHLVAEAGKRSK